MQGGELFLGKSAGPAIPGNLQINGGGVFLTNSNQIVNTATVVINGGVLDIGSRTSTIGLLGGTGGEIKCALGTLTTGGAGGSTWAGLLSGNGVNSLIKTGSGTLTLTNALLCQQVGHRGRHAGARSGTSPRTGRGGA